MNSREIVKRCITFGGPERIGYDFASPQPSDFVASGWGRGRITVYEEEDPEIRRQVPGFPGQLYRDEYGNIWGRLNDRYGGEVVKGVLQDGWDRLDGYRLPDYGSPEDDRQTAALFAANADRYHIAALPGFPFAIMRYMRRMDHFLMDLVLHEQEVLRLNELVVAMLLGLIERYGADGADAVMFCEDWGIQDRLLVSPRTWRKIFKPSFRRLAGRAHDLNLHVIMHSCGFIYPIVEDLIEVGIDVLQLDQPELIGVDRLAAEFGGRIAFYCPVDIQTVMQTGDKALIQAAATRLVARLGAFRGGFIAKDYPHGDALNVQPEWAESARRRLYGARRQTVRDVTRRCLDRLEALVDPDHVARTRTLQRRAFAFEPVDHIPTVIAYPVPEDEWPNPSYQQFYDDREWMLLNELKLVYMGARLQDDRLYGIRANYGTGIVASLFGCPIHTFEDVLPVATAAGDRAVIEALTARGVPDLYTGICGHALRTVTYYREVLADYPRLSRCVTSQMLDIQGTFDNASIIWGSSIFYAMVDEPSAVQSLMRVVSDTLAALVEEHRRLDGGDLHEHSGAWESLGGICLRADSCINLSRRMYERYVKPFDRELLGRYDGWVHFCGKAHQWWNSLLDVPGLRGINPYQGEFYDLGKMYAQCRAHKVAIVQWTVPVAAAERETIRTGFSRILSVQSYDEARRIVDRTRETGWPDGED